MEEIGKPYLRIVAVKHANGKRDKYLSIAVKVDDGSKWVKTKTIRSFGNVEVAENWDKAIEFMLDSLRTWYKAQKERYVGSR